MMRRFLGLRPRISTVLFGAILVTGGLALFFSSIYSVVTYQVFISEGPDVMQSLQYGSWPALSNADFFMKTRQEFINQKASFLEADLTTMKLRVYTEGALSKEMPILTKGRPGSWWETPAGLYTINSKEKNHFSSFGQVYSPWSMGFQGNFFVHGWPYYPDGTPVKSTYSGGCVRLSDKDAEEIFKMTKVGTPILVFEEAFGSDAFVYRAPAPDIPADAYLAADLKNNFVFFKKESTQVLPVASLTKLVTALVAAEYINLDQEVTVTTEMLVHTSKPRLRVGQRISTFNLLYPLLLESSNEAAHAIASLLGENRFVSLMNAKATAVGMRQTRFVDPAGSGEGNVSSAEDLFALSKYLYHNRSFILKLSAGRITNSAYGTAYFKDLKNLNVFDKDPRFVGGKVGQTIEAKQVILSVFELEFLGEKRPVVLIALGSNDREKDATAMLAHVSNSF